MIVFYPGDGSERCLICGWRSRGASLYVGRRGVVTFEGLPERFPVCSEVHGDVFMSRLLVTGEVEADKCP